MQLDTFFQYIYGFFGLLASQMQNLGIPLGAGDWFFIIYTLFFIIILVVVHRGKGKGTYQP